MTLASPFRAFALAAVAALLVAGSAHAELAKWDQAKVTDLAKQLAVAGDAWEQAMRRQPGLTEGSGTSGDDFDMLLTSRRVKEQSQALAGQLADGKGYDKTLDMFKTLKEIVDDANVYYARDEVILPTEESWGTFTALYDQIAPYYLADIKK